MLLEKRKKDVCDYLRNQCHCFLSSTSRHDGVDLICDSIKSPEMAMLSSSLERFQTFPPLFSWVLSMSGCFSLWEAQRTSFDLYAPSGKLRSPLRSHESPVFEQAQRKDWEPRPSLTFLCLLKVFSFLRLLVQRSC